MTAPLKWRSQLCPCGYCPDGTRVEWRHNLFELLFDPDHGLDIHFKSRRKERDDILYPRRRVSGLLNAAASRDGRPVAAGSTLSEAPAANPSGRTHEEWMQAIEIAQGRRKRR